MAVPITAGTYDPDRALREDFHPKSWSYSAGGKAIPDTYRFETTLWVASGGSWHFVSLPNHDSDDILERAGAPGPGFGSVRVAATLGGTRWLTSIFPDSKRGTYVLPVKKAVRTAENVADGDLVTITLDVL